MKISICFAVTLIILTATSCLKDETQYIDKIQPSIFDGEEIQNGEYIVVRDQDLDENDSKDTTIYEFIGIDSVISMQTTTSGKITLHGTWKRTKDSIFVMTFEPGTADEMIERYNTAFNITYNSKTYLLLAPVMHLIGDSSTLVGQFNSYVECEYPNKEEDNYEVHYIISIYNTGKYEAHSIITMGDSYDYLPQTGVISPEEINAKYYQLIRFQGKYYLYGLFAGKYEKVN